MVETNYHKPDVFIFSCEHTPVNLPYYTNFYRTEFIEEKAEQLRRCKKYNDVVVIFDNDSKDYAQLRLS